MNAPPQSPPSQIARWYATLKNVHPHPLSAGAECMFASVPTAATKAEQITFVPGLLA